jgi:hypothetical protein
MIFCLIAVSRGSSIPAAGLLEDESKIRYTEANINIPIHS